MRRVKRKGSGRGCDVTETKLFPIGVLMRIIIIMATFDPGGLEIHI